MMSKENFYVNEYALLDEGTLVGDGTKIWHFSHIQSGSTIGSI